MNAITSLMTLWAQTRKPAILHFDQISRAKVLLGISAILILGIVMVYIAALGARLTRRYAARAEPREKKLPPKSSVPRTDDWADKPLVPLNGASGADEPTGKSKGPNDLPTK